MSPSILVFAFEAQQGFRFDHNGALTNTLGPFDA